MVQFVSAEQRDLPLLFSLNKTLIDSYEDTSKIDYERVLKWVEQNLTIQLPNFRRIIYDGRLAGFFCLAEKELDSLFVLPEFRGKGIGTAVLRHCQEESVELMLYVFRNNIQAMALYKRMGFEITKEVGSTRYIMEWKKELPD